MPFRDIEQVVGGLDVLEYDNGDSSTADTIDWTLSKSQKSTLTGNCVFTFTAPLGIGDFQLKLIQDGTGSRTVTWPATVASSGNVKPVLSTTIAAVDLIKFYYDGALYHITNFIKDSRNA